MQQQNKQEVVITGIGAITPIGSGKEGYWSGLMAAKSGIARITHFDPAAFDVQIAAQVPDFDPSAYMERREARRMDRFAQMGVAAALQAVEDAGLTIDDSNSERVGVLIGSGIGGLQSLEDAMRTLIEKGPARVTPLLIPLMIADMVTGHVSIITGAKGPGSCVVTACATGANVIGDATEMLRRGIVDVVIAGGSEAAICPTGIAGFGNMQAMTKKFNDNPQAASRPFEADRDGFVMGEGAGVVILETREYAERRGAAHMYATVAGYGMSSDAYHMTAPRPGGEGVARAFKMALADAQMQPEEIGYVNAHGTSTPLNDEHETAALKLVFGDHARKLAVSSTKSMTGHLLGAAGAIEAIACALAFERDMLPPTINYVTPDPLCDLDYVPNSPRAAHVDAVACNNSGFGGHNAVLVFRRFVG